MKLYEVFLRLTSQGGVHSAADCVILDKTEFVSFVLELMERLGMRDIMVAEWASRHLAERSLVDTPARWRPVPAIESLATG